MKETELKPKYAEIKKLFDYCIKIGINAEIVKLYDGYIIVFPNASDFIQHQYSYGGEIGYVEPLIGCRLDCTAISLKQAKALVRYHKDQLNRRADNEQRED